MLRCARNDGGRGEGEWKRRLSFTRVCGGVVGAEVGEYFVGGKEGGIVGGAGGEIGADFGAAFGGFGEELEAGADDIAGGAEMAAGQLAFDLLGEFEVQGDFGHWGSHADAALGTLPRRRGSA